MDFSDGELELYFQLLSMSDKYRKMADNHLNQLIIQKRIASFDDKRG